jgi:oxygen-independent coproporphyrinogen-3 oxidase
LHEIGYEEIGMDHFALKSDSLYKAAAKGRLHRNFMGYTESDTSVMIGLGMSSISDSWYAFAQNSKSLEEYTELVNQDILPVFRGHILSNEDLVIRQHILNIMCKLETNWSDTAHQFQSLPACLERLKVMEDDGLIEIHQNGLRVPEYGRPFVRNICMAFDVHLHQNQPEQRIFSMTV